MTRAPEPLDRTEDGFAIEAERLADLLRLSVAQVREEMRAGRIVTRVEKGEGEDAGTWRLTFQRGGDRARVIVDDAGRELRRSRVFASLRADAPPAAATNADPAPATAAHAETPPATARAILPGPAEAPRPGETELRAVVEAFYTRVRSDAELGPLFEDAVHDWPAHLDRIAAFWSSAMLGSGAYKGDPFGRHRPHAARMSPALFDRWLALWRETTDALLSPEAAALAQAKAARIAASLRMALAPAGAADGFRLPS